MDLASQVQVLSMTVYISHSTNSLGKGMKSKSSPSSYLGQAGLFKLGIAIGLGERKLWIQTSYRPGERWALPGYSCPRHATWVVPPWPNHVTGYV